MGVRAQSPGVRAEYYARAWGDRGRRGGRRQPGQGHYRDPEAQNLRRGRLVHTAQGHLALAGPGHPAPDPAPIPRPSDGDQGPKRSQLASRRCRGGVPLGVMSDRSVSADA